MILQKSLIYANLVLKKHFLLISILKTVLLPNIFVETVKPLNQDSLINRKIKRTAFLKIEICIFFTVIFDQFNLMINYKRFEL